VFSKKKRRPSFAGHEALLLARGNMEPSHQTNAQDRDSPNVLFMPPLMFLICLISGIALGNLLPCGFPWVSDAMRFLGGGVLTLAGFTFVIIGYGRFRALKVTVKTIRPASSLVTGGVYRFSRNPMYIGLVLTLAGLGAIAGNPWLSSTMVPMALYLNYYVIPREETYLQRRFGESYSAYCASVRRWL
jgi:protein-S-isoprenylcysteine O-methyltransferase Ste14